jgi:hypothetical protein
MRKSLKDKKTVAKNVAKALAEVPIDKKKERDALRARLRRKYGELKRLRTGMRELAIGLLIQHQRQAPAAVWPSLPGAECWLGFLWAGVWVGPATILATPTSSGAASLCTTAAAGC